LLLAIEEQFSSGKRQTRTRFVRDVIITRTWVEDARFVEPRIVWNARRALSAIIEAWKRQVAAEFDEALPDGGETEGASVLTFHDDVELHSDSCDSWVVKFRVTLDFWYCDLGKSFTNDHDLISHIFYAEGGVAGNYKLLSSTEEQTALEEC
jgi:hypothetical protein